MITPVVPCPAYIQPFCKPVSSISVKRLGAYSLNPLKLTKKGPLTNIPVQDGEIVEEIKQVDTNVFQIDVTDETGQVSTYSLVVPDP
jgi:hypothetical protein